MADYQMSGSPVGYGGQGAFHTQTSETDSSGMRMGTYANVAGAAVSLALLLGVGIWGYQLLVRDVSGVPVVKASAGPWRVAPENPGGQAADNQGLAVNEVAGRGTASGPVDRVALAPPPIGLQEEDVPSDRLAIPALARVQSTAAQLAGAEETPEPTILGAHVDSGVGAAPMSEADTIQALAEQIAANATPLGQAAPADAVAVAVAAQRTGPGLNRSPRPRNRPAQLVRSSQAAAAAAVATPAVAEVPIVEAAALTAGTRLVQLGAYESAAIAEQEWTRIAGRFDSFFDGKARVIQKAKSGGRTFYRLRAHGFADLAEARRFCAALVAERADCIPVVVK